MIRFIFWRLKSSLGGIAKSTVRLPHRVRHPFMYPFSFFGFGGYGCSVENGRVARPEVHDDRFTVLDEVMASETRENITKNGKHVLYSYDIFHPGYSLSKDIRILHISDLHISKKSPRKSVIDAYISLVKKLHVDYVFLTGDVVHMSPVDIHGKEPFLRALASCGTRAYAVSGNHDYWYREKPGSECFDALKEVMENKCGFTYLMNEHVRFDEDKLTIVGLEDFLYGSMSPEVFDSVEKGDFVVVLAHNLDSVTSQIKVPVHLILSGHLHAGEVEVFGLNGVQYLKSEGAYFNLNKQIKGFKWLTDDALSFINPGAYTSSGIRHNTPKQGMTLLTLKADV